jgi:hypothetical protein
MRGPRRRGAPRCANSKRICDLVRRGQRTGGQESAPKRKRPHKSGGFPWAGCAEASQPLGSRVESCVVHHDFVQRSKIGRADDARYLGGGVTSCLCDLLVRLKRIFPDREQDSIVPTLVTGIGALWHCSTSLLVTLYLPLHSPTASIASSMLLIVFKGWLANVLNARIPAFALAHDPTHNCLGPVTSNSFLLQSPL